MVSLLSRVVEEGLHVTLLLIGDWIHIGALLPLRITEMRCIGSREYLAAGVTAWPKLHVQRHDAWHTIVRGIP